MSLSANDPEFLAARIKRMKQENEENESLGPHSARFSRACRNCHKESTHPRLVSTACGHAVCHECTQRMYYAFERSACPVSRCWAQASFVKLHETDDRKCPICLCEQPMKRCAFRACGHVVCDACYYQMRKESIESSREVRCPFCRASATVGTKSFPIWMEEARIEVVNIGLDGEYSDVEIIEDVRFAKIKEEGDSDIEIIVEEAPRRESKAKNACVKRRRDVNRRRDKEPSCS